MTTQPTVYKICAETNISGHGLLIGSSTCFDCCQRYSSHENSDYTVVIVLRLHLVTYMLKLILYSGKIVSPSSLSNWLMHWQHGLG